MPKGIRLTREKQEKRRREIFNASVHLFVEQGFNETSMREIAIAAGVGKSTLYDYYKSKDEIMISFFEDYVREIEERAQDIIAQDLSVSEKLRGIMRTHLDYLLDDENVYLKLSLEFQRLSAPNRRRLQVIRYAYQDLLSSLITEGIRRGELRSINPLFAARSIFMLLTNAIYTSRPTGTPEDMLEEALGIFFRGVQA